MGFFLKIHDRKPLERQPPIPFSPFVWRLSTQRKRRPGFLCGISRMRSVGLRAVCVGCRMRLRIASMLNAACGDGLRSCETSRVVEGCDRAERRMSRRAADARPWFAARGRVAPQAPRAAQPTAPGAVRRVATCNALLYALLLRRRCRWMRSPRRAALLHALFAPPCVAGRGVCVSIGRRARCRGATICLFTCTKTVEGVRRFTKRRYNARCPTVESAIRTNKTIFAK